MDSRISLFFLGGWEKKTNTNKPQPTSTNLTPQTYTKKKKTIPVKSFFNENWLQIFSKLFCSYEKEADFSGKKKNQEY